MPISVPLPRVRVAGLSLPEALARLDTAARRGRMAGLALPEPGAPRRAGAPLFSVAAFGTPFDGLLEAFADGPAPASAVGGAERASGVEMTLRFRVRLRPLVPAVFLAVLILSIWPGVLLMDSFLGLIPGSSTWWPTWWWYVPLMVATSPLAWRTAWGRSRATAHDSGHRMVAKIARELGGTVDPAPPGP